MEFSAWEPLNIDIQTQSIPLKSPLDKDNLWREIPQLVGGVGSVLRSPCSTGKWPLPPRTERSPSSLINDKQCHLVAICVLFVLDNEKGASQASFLRTGKKSHLIIFLMQLNDRNKRVTELLPVRWPSLGRPFVDGLSASEWCEVHTNHTE